MAAASIANELDSVPERLQRIQKSFADLDAQRGLLASCTTAWQELEDYFSEVQATIQRKADGLLERKRGFEAEVSQEKAAVGKREEAVAVREKASLARVEEQKDAAIAALMAERSRWIEENLGDRAGAYLAKEADAARRESRAKAGAGRTTSDVRVRPQLKDFFQKSDGKGLWDYLALDRKDDVALRKELPVALEKYSTDAVGFVLKVLEFYKVHPNPNRFGKSRNACLTMLEALAPIMADPILGVARLLVSPEMKEVAKKIAKAWRDALHLDADVPNVAALDAQCFLQLLLTFDLASEYKKDDLVKLVAVTATTRKHAVSICKSLGLSEKAPDLVEKLAKSGKQLEALSFAEAFGIMDKIEPVPILKEFLRVAKKAAELAMQKAPNAAAGENEATQKELSALRAVLKAVDNYKLQPSFPVDNLQMRIEQLEKAREDRRKEKRRASLAGKPEEKKARLHENKAGDDKTPIKLGGVAAACDEYRDLPPYGPSAVHHYDRLPEAVFDSAVRAASKKPELLPNSFEHPLDRIGPTYGPTSTYSSLSGLYGDYKYTSALAQSSAHDLGPPSSYKSAYELGPTLPFRSAYELGPSASYQSAFPSYQPFKL